MHHLFVLDSLFLAEHVIFVTPTCHTVNLVLSMLCPSCRICIGELCPMLMEAKTVPVVIQAMNSCADHDELLQSSVWIFSSLAFTGTGNERALLSKTIL